MKRIVDWIDRAEQWHFWNPGSGLLGGTLAGALFALGMILAEKLA